MTPNNNILKAKFLGKTSIAGVEKNRWECPNCRIKKNPECRFNLTPKNKVITKNCRFCKQALEIRDPNNKKNKK